MGTSAREVIWCIGIADVPVIGLFGLFGDTASAHNKNDFWLRYSAEYFNVHHFRYSALGCGGRGQQTTSTEAWSMLSLCSTCLTHTCRSVPVGSQWLWNVSDEPSIYFNAAVCLAHVSLCRTFVKLPSLTAINSCRCAAVYTRRVANEC